MSGSHAFPHYSDLTFGIEGGNSAGVLKVHWPGGVSGVTLSAGYDMGARSVEEVRKALADAGVPAGDAEALSQGAGKKGQTAKTWVHDHVGTLPTISKDAAKTLFEHIYPEYVKRAEHKVKEWGGDWGSYPTKMKEVLVDLAYRGDLADKHKPHLIKSIKEGDYGLFCAAIHDLDYWQEHTNLKHQKPKGAGGTYTKDQRGGYNWRILGRSDYLDKAPPVPDTHSVPQKTPVSLAALSQDQLYDHLHACWSMAQERFGNKGNALYDFKEGDRELNLLGARGFDEATLTPVPSTNTKYDDTLFCVYKKDGKKHVDPFAYSSEWTRTGASAILVLGQHRYWINIHHKDATYVKLSDMASYAAYGAKLQELKNTGKKLGYRALNPDPGVPIVRQADRNKVAAAGSATKGTEEGNATINVHYGGEGLVVQDQSRAWSDGCQVIAGWSNYIRFMRIVESDKSLKGSAHNELEPPGAGSRSLIYTLVEGDFLQPRHLGVSFPIDAGGGREVTADAIAAFYRHTEGESKSGYFPLGTNTTWHGGVHLRAPAGASVTAVLDGKIVAARLLSDPGKAMGAFGSRNFILMQHEVTGATLNAANSFLARTLVGYTVRAKEIPLRPDLGSSAAGGTLPRLRMGDEVLLKEVKHQKVGAAWFAHVAVKRSSVAGLEKREGWIQASAELVNPLYKDPDPVFKPDEKKTFFSLYMHLGCEKLEEARPVFASIPWVHRDRLEVVAETLHLRSSPELAAKGNIVADLARGDKLTPRGERVADKKEKGLAWMPVAVARAKNASLVGKEGYVAITEGKTVKQVREPSQWFLKQLEASEIVKLDEKVKAGAPIWTSSGGALHWEIFSEENLLPKCHKAEDPDDDMNMDVKEIFQMVEQEWIGFDDNLSAEELQAFYAKNPKAKQLRGWACKFMSEWGIDVDKAVDKLSAHQAFVTYGLADRLRPYPFWREARDKKVALPASPNVWHYNPVTFLHALARGLEKPAPPQEAPPAKASSSDLELSGKAWVSRFETSTSLDALAEPFEDHAKAFVAALKEAGATVHISATYRPKERAYLMHYAWLVADGSVKAKDVPRHDGVAIQWDHGADSASAAAAKEMVAAYHIAFKPSLTSRHTEGLAIDVDITWNHELRIKNHQGETVVITSAPRTGAGNAELWAVGATYGVHKLTNDRPHWSSDGH